jgi:2-C-methyl-D-erythritol 4-phosphate cytidylyltransferase
MNYYAIIVAGGSGSRMNAEVPKQFLLLQGRPILMHTMEAFFRCGLNPTLILVLNIHQHAYWEGLCEQYNFTIPHQLVSGGTERFHSVSNGLSAIKGNGIVAVHDAVRPLVSPELIKRSYVAAEAQGNVVVSIKPTDSIRKIEPSGRSEALNRNMVALIQTPQMFDVKLLKKAYLQPFRNEFTDDASVVEHMGTAINLIEGERQNIKITFQEDLDIATYYLTKKASE